MENQELLYTVAEKVAEAGQKYNVPVIFKSSFDKANRTSIHSYRGPGIEKGMEMLLKVKERFGLPPLPTSTSPATRPLPAKSLIYCRSRRFYAAKPTCWLLPQKPGK